MRGLTERMNREVQRLSREEQDAFSVRSSQLAATAQKNGVFDEEIVPVEIPQRKGDPIVVFADEGVSGDTTTESLGKLCPVFAKDGTITAGSASQISDGAAEVIVMSKAKAEELGLSWIAGIGASGVVAALTRASKCSQSTRSPRPPIKRALAPPISTWSKSTRPSPQ